MVNPITTRKTVVGIAQAQVTHSLTGRPCVSKLALLLVMGISMSACSKTIVWKEEILLHDGRKMVVTRSQVRSGAGEIGQGPPITEHALTFMAASSQTITWKSESSADIRHADLDLLALDIVKGTPYIATMPTGCVAYERWGRPNPPYVFFKHSSHQWKRIPLDEFPMEIKRPNVTINTYQIDDIKAKGSNSGIVSAVGIDELNSSLRLGEHKAILRDPIARTGRSASAVDCADRSSPQHTSPKAPNSPLKSEKTN